MKRAFKRFADEEKFQIFMETRRIIAKVREENSLFMARYRESKFNRVQNEERRLE